MSKLKATCSLQMLIKDIFVQYFTVHYFHVLFIHFTLDRFATFYAKYQSSELRYPLLWIRLQFPQPKRNKIKYKCDNICQRSERNRCQPPARTRTRVPEHP
jgi:hypothetical protein